MITIDYTDGPEIVTDIEWDDLPLIVQMDVLDSIFTALDDEMERLKNLARDKAEGRASNVIELVRE